MSEYSNWDFYYAAELWLLLILAAPVILLFEIVARVSEYGGIDED